MSFSTTTMESDKYICVREAAPANSVVIVETANPGQPLRRPMTADSALMNPVAKVIALKAAVPGSAADHLQIFNLELKSKMKSHQMPEQVVFWKWLTPALMGLVTATAVYHWSVEVRSCGVGAPARLGGRIAVALRDWRGAARAAARADSPAALRSCETLRVARLRPVAPPLRAWRAAVRGCTRATRAHAAGARLRRRETACP